MSISATYVDTGTSDYLQDHHNRPHELLISIPCCAQSVDVAMQEAMDQVNDEPRVHAGLNPDHIRSAIRGVLESVDLRPFDPMTGKRTEHMDDDEYSYVWILLKFDVLRARLRLTIDVDYSLNGDNVERVVACAQDDCHLCRGEWPADNGHRCRGLRVEVKSGDH